MSGRHCRRPCRRNDKWSPLLVSNEAADEMGGRRGQGVTEIVFTVYGLHADIGMGNGNRRTRRHTVEKGG